MHQRESRSALPVMLLAMLLATLLDGCSGSGGGPARGGEPAGPRQVMTARPEAIAWTQTIELGGTLEAPERVEIAARIEGAVIGLEVDLGQHLVGGMGQEGRIDLATSRDHEVTGLRPGEVEGLLHRVGDQHAVVAPPAMAGQHDGGAPREGPTDRLEGGASHEQGVPPGELLELRLLTREPPRDVGAVADDPVAGVGGDEDDALVGTEHGTDPTEDGPWALFPAPVPCDVGGPHPTPRRIR